MMVRISTGRSVPYGNARRLAAPPPRAARALRPPPAGGDRDRRPRVRRARLPGDLDAGPHRGHGTRGRGAVPLHRQQGAAAAPHLRRAARAAARTSAGDRRAAGQRGGAPARAAARLARAHRGAPAPHARLRAGAARDRARLAVARGATPTQGVREDPRRRARTRRAGRDDGVHRPQPDAARAARHGQPHAAVAQAARPPQRRADRRRLLRPAAEGGPAVSTAAPPVLWTPAPERVERATLTRYARWLEERLSRSFGSYDELWQWSVGELDAFWRSIWDFFEVHGDGSPERVLGSREMPGAEWFPDVALNYAEHVFRGKAGDQIAIRHASEARPLAELTWGELRTLTARTAAGLRAQGVGRGDRVVAYLPNVPEAIAAMLACASIGAVWSDWSPDLGGGNVGER